MDASGEETCRPRAIPALTVWHWAQVRFFRACSEWLKFNAKALAVSGVRTGLPGWWQTPQDPMFRPPDSVRGPWQVKHVVWAFKRDGMERATPRRAGLWHVAQFVCRECFAWSNTALKLLSRGNGLTLVAV